MAVVQQVENTWTEELATLLSLRCPALRAASGGVREVAAVLDVDVRDDMETVTVFSDGEAVEPAQVDHIIVRPVIKDFLEGFDEDFHSKARMVIVAQWGPNGARRVCERLETDGDIAASVEESLRLAASQDYELGDNGAGFGLQSPSLHSPGSASGAQWRRGGSVPGCVGGVDTSSVSVAESGSYVGLDHYEDLAAELSSYGDGNALYRGEELSPVVGVVRCAAGKQWVYAAFSAVGEQTRWATDTSACGAFAWLDVVADSLDYGRNGHSAVAVFDTQRKQYLYGLVEDFGEDASVNRTHALAALALLGDRAGSADVAVAKRLVERRIARHK